MVDPIAILGVRAGSFVRLTLRGGPTISRLAAADPTDARFLRFDSKVAEDDGELSEFSLRLRPDQIESVQVLEAAPAFVNQGGTTFLMPASFWPD